MMKLSTICYLLLAIALAPLVAQVPKNVQKSSDTATINQITGDLKFGTGRTLSFLSGSTLSIAGTLSGTPTAGTLDLSALTLTLPATVSGGTSSFQPLDSDLTSIAALTTTANGRSLLTASALTAVGIGLTNGATIDAWGAVTDSAGLAGRLSDETGTGAAVFAISPTLTTPNIGAATGTSVNLTGAGAFGGDVAITKVQPAWSLVNSGAGGATWTGYIAADSGNFVLDQAGAINGLTLTKTTGAMAVAGSITAASATSLTLAGGSSGASLVLGQGENGTATLTPKGTGIVAVGGVDASGPATYTSQSNGGLVSYQDNSGTFGFNRYLDVIAAQVGDGVNGGGIIRFLTNTKETSAVPVEAARITKLQNLLIGGTTDTSARLLIHPGADTRAAGIRVNRSSGTEYAELSDFAGITVLASKAAAPQIALQGTTDGSSYTSLAAFTTTELSLPQTTASTNSTTGSLIIGSGPSTSVGIGGGAIFTGAGVTVGGDLAVSGGNVGVGTAAMADRGLWVDSDTLTGTQQFGIVSTPVFSSAATTSGAAYTARLDTAAAAFTLTDGYGLRVDQPTLGSGSAITNVYGIRVLSQGATGITNAYGIDIAAQSGASTTNVGLRNAGSTILSGTLTLSGGLVSYGANDSGGAGFRQVLVPNL